MRIGAKRRLTIPPSMGYATDWIVLLCTWSLKKKTFCFAFGCLVSCMVPLVHCKASVPILWHSLTLWWDDKCWSTFFGPYLFLCLNKQGTPPTKLWMSQSGRHGKTCGSGLRSGQSSCGSNESRVILSGLKTGSGQSGCGSGRVGLAHIFHMNFFIFYFYKENNMYLPFGKLCNKLLDVKCIILNSPLISIINLVKLINTYSIILTLYKS